MSVCLRCQKYERKSFVACPACTKELSTLSKLAQEKYKREPKVWVPLERWSK